MLLSLVSPSTEQDCIPVMRGMWFIDGTWLPLEEDESDLIELEHLTSFRGQHMQDSFESDVVAKTVDSKDGETPGEAWPIPVPFTRTAGPPACKVPLFNTWVLAS